MGQVTVQIGGRGYPLACRDGEEPHLKELAGILDRKASELNAGLGVMSEARLLLMAGILIADELFDSRKARALHLVDAGGGDEATSSRVEALTLRLEALADTLETNGVTPG